MRTDPASAASFYDDLAPYYDLLYDDWERSVSQQGRALSSLLLKLGVVTTDPILDAACGIGTQTLGLAQLGHNLTASDVSPVAIDRLQRELGRRGLSVRTRVDDLRTLTHVQPGSLAAVLACDNSIPHLLSDAEILQAFQAANRCLRPGGLLVLSVRDYAAIPRVTPDVRPYGLRHRGGCRFLAVQVWEWDGELYNMSMYLTTESSSGECITRVLRSRYYGITIERLWELLGEAGYGDIQRHDDVLFQPVLTARRPNTP